MNEEQRAPTKKGAGDLIEIAGPNYLAVRQV
jgi:hypothetical protein